MKTLREMMRVLVMLTLLLICGNVVAALSVADLAPEGFGFEMPADLSKEAALIALDDGEEIVVEMKKQNLSVTFVNDALAEAERAFEEEDYVTVFELSQLVRYVYDDGIYFLDSLVLVEQRISGLRDEGADITGVQAALDNAKSAFYKEQFDEAHELLAQADAVLKETESDYRRAVLIKRFSKNFLLRYWWQIILVLAVIGVVSYPAVKSVRKRLLKKHIEKLKGELDSAQQLIKALQKKCFIEKKINTSTYQLKVEHYEDKIAEIKYTLPVLEAQLRGEKVKQEEKNVQWGLKIEK